MELNKNDIIQTYFAIKQYIETTPILSSKYINQIFKANILFKCENFQKGGSFKYRGAVNSAIRLYENNENIHIATHSSGNHAAAIAKIAKVLNIKATVVMPSTSNKAKIKNVEKYGANIVFCEPTLENREKTLKHIILEHNAIEIHPYNSMQTIAGQSTVFYESLSQLSAAPDFVISPVGGGGLLSGTAITAKYFTNNCKVIGAEPANADDAFNSFYSKIYQKAKTNPNTIADGLKTSLGTLNFDIISKNVDNIFTVSEDSIVKNMKIIWEEMKIIVEPSSAVALAVVAENKNIFKDKNVLVILSGGNVDINNLPF